jgi:hypothetical protein
MRYASPQVSRRARASRHSPRAPHLVSSPLRRAAACASGSRHGRRFAPTRQAARRASVPRTISQVRKQTPPLGCSRDEPLRSPLRSSPGALAPHSGRCRSRCARPHAPLAPPRRVNVAPAALNPARGGPISNGPHRAENQTQPGHAITARAIGPRAPKKGELCFSAARPSRALRLIRPRISTRTLSLSTVSKRSRRTAHHSHAAMCYGVHSGHHSARPSVAAGVQFPQLDTTNPQ